MSDADDPHDPAFARAWEQVDGAREDRRRLVECWTEFCDAEGLSADVQVDDGGQGRVVVAAAWPGRLLETASESALRFAVHLRGAFDEALLAAAGRVSGVVEAPDPEAHRLPSCRSPDELAAYIADGGLRGLRHDQVQAIEQFLPYEEAHDEVGVARRLRLHMRHLMAMLEEDRDPDRPRVAIWAHSADPEVLDETSNTLLECVSTGDGILEKTRTVATFSSVDAPQVGLQANPKVAFDPIFNDDPLPVDPDDNMSTRSTFLIAAASEFIRGMERSVGSRPPRPSRPASFADAVHPVSGSPWGLLELEESPKRTEIEAAFSRADVSTIAHHDPEGNITILVRSDGRVFGRPVPAALPLDPGLAPGTAAEDASLTAASRWGLPDFVMRSQGIRKGAASREVGDGTIVAGGRGLAVQVKSRGTAPRDADRETKWLLKNVSKGASQARGTVRTLRLGTVELTNQRGRTIRVEGAAVEWVGVVIVDHPSPPKVVVEDRAAEGDLPIVMLLRRDWDFLFDHLRSVSAVVDYIHRVAKHDPEIIGHEPYRYYRLAQDDENTTPNPVPAWMRNFQGITPASRPLLPKRPASNPDTTGHTVFRAILEDIATASLDRPEEERLEVLALVDRFSVGDRADLGRLLLNHLDAVEATQPGTTEWRFRRVIAENGLLQLAFGACNHLTSLHHDAFKQWAMLRHHEFAKGVPVSAPREQTTIAILLTPRHDGYRAWDTTMFAIWGDEGLTEEDVEAIRAIWEPVGRRR